MHPAPVAAHHTKRLTAIAACALAVGCASTSSSLAPRTESPPVVTASDTTTTAAPSDHATERASWTIEEVVAEALARHPRLAAAKADQRAASARVDETRFGYLPAAGVSGEINRSTSNNMSGTFFPVQGFPSISGTTTTKSLDVPSTWQTGVSLWASWDILSLARQAANVDVALAQRHVASAQLDVERLEVAWNAADAFLLLLEADEAVRAQRAGVERAETIVNMTKPLVEQTLRPGVDLARAQAELAVARTSLARAEQVRDARRTALAVAMGHARDRLEIVVGKLLDPVDALSAPRGLDPASNPKIIEATAAADRVGAARNVVNMEFLPRVDLVAAIFARGSGASTTASADGLVPDTANWAAGAVVSWSILDIPRIASRSRAASADYAAAIARRDEVVLEVTGQLETASAILEGARRVARETPIALAAARDAERQAAARYQASLAPIVDVADAERVLTQSDVADSIARVEVRRALLLLARAAGDLEPFFR
jgi:outer membrane protein